MSYLSGDRVIPRPLGRAVVGAATLGDVAKALILHWKLRLSGEYCAELGMSVYTLAMSMPSMLWLTSVTSHDPGALVGLAKAEQARLLAMCMPEDCSCHVLAKGYAHSPDQDWPVPYRPRHG